MYCKYFFAGSAVKTEILDCKNVIFLGLTRLAKFEAKSDFKMRRTRGTVSFKIRF